MTGKSARLALLGISSALAVVILLFTLIPTANIALAALAALTAIPLVIELGKKAAMLHYVAVAILSLLVVPDPEGKGLYIAFFGYYTVLKAVIEERRWPRWAEWGVKLAVFNAATVTAYWVMLTFVGLPPDSFTIAGVSLPWVFLLAGNGVFLLYDRAMTGLIRQYLHRWRQPLRRLFRL